MNERESRVKLTQKVIHLGRTTHQLVREGEISKEEIKKISDEICLLEKQVHELSGNSIPTIEEGKCPNCKTPYEEETVFCGNCGQNIKEFYELSSEECDMCKSIISKDANFCGVCGSKVNK